MNELDDRIAQLFAQEERGSDNEAFVAAVRRRIAKQRRKAKALALGLAAAIVVVAGGMVVLAPAVLLYPVQILQALLSSPLTALAIAVGTAGIVWWHEVAAA